jgi:hypothetical protein
MYIGMQHQPFMYSRMPIYNCCQALVSSNFLFPMSGFFLDYTGALAGCWVNFEHVDGGFVFLHFCGHFNGEVFPHVVGDDSSLLVGSHGGVVAGGDAEERLGVLRVHDSFHHRIICGKNAQSVRNVQFSWSICNVGANNRRREYNGRKT